jgi:hypothetical protein
MYQRLTTSEVAAVQRALAAGMRHVDIARELDLSVWTIARIADRRRFQRIDDEIDDHTNPTRKRGTETAVLPNDLPEDDGPPDYQAQNLHRCPGCGAMIYVTPCIACRMANAIPAAVPFTGDNEVDEDSDDNRLTAASRRRSVRKIA